jgi:hypothetical protein
MDLKKMDSYIPDLSALINKLLRKKLLSVSTNPITRQIVRELQSQKKKINILKLFQFIPKRK